MKRAYPLLLTIIITGSCCAQISFAQHKREGKSKVRFINPKTLSKPPGYTHVVEVTGGRTVYIAGQIALDSSDSVVGRGDFRAQSVQVFENLKAALEAVGASFDDVVKLNIYMRISS